MNYEEYSYQCRKDLSNLKLTAIPSKSIWLHRHDVGEKINVSILGKNFNISPRSYDNHDNDVIIYRYCISSDKFSHDEITYNIHLYTIPWIYENTQWSDEMYHENAIHSNILVFVPDMVSEIQYLNIFENSIHEILNKVYTNDIFNANNSDTCINDLSKIILFINGEIALVEYNELIIMDIINNRCEEIKRWLKQAKYKRITM